MKQTSLQKSASKFVDHKRKALIRKNWCKPQLQQLTSIVKNKLVYLGLPDIEALDIKEWIDYIDKVIAFQCSKYEGEEIDVKQLDNYLNSLERQSKIRSWVVYQGWMEDIIMGGISERGQTYKQNDFLRVYNLDFCNNLKTPREVISEKGKKINVVYKTDIIQKLLEHQKTATPEVNHRNFIMYLTVNANTFNIGNAQINDASVKEYLKKVGKIHKPEVRAAREVKAYCYHVLGKIFKEQDFHVEFLPPVYYMGTSYPNKQTGASENHKMMTFTVLGSQRTNNEAFLEQDSSLFLNQKFIFATDTKISSFEDRFIGNYIKETDCEHDATKLINTSLIVQKFWSAETKGQK